MLDPVTGLGYPAHFSAPNDEAAAGVSGRDERLFALAQQAVIDGVSEVVLDDAAVQALAGIVKQIPVRARPSSPLAMLPELAEGVQHAVGDLATAPF